MRIYTLTFLFLTTLLTVAFAQVHEDWVRRYNGQGIGNDQVRAIALDNSGNVYITGSSEGAGSGYDFVTIKYNSSGAQQWLQRYIGPGDSADYATSIAVDGSGNVYVAGNTYAVGTGANFATIKYNTSGVQQWVQIYNGPGSAYDGAISIAVDLSGNVVVTGTSLGSGTSDDITTIKYSSSGVQMWVQRYNGQASSADDPCSLAIDGSGNIYVTGSSVGSGTAYDYVTIKYNAGGVQQWVQRYNGPGNGIDIANDLKIDGSGNIYITGESTGTGTLRDYGTIKYNSSGVQQWVSRYNGPADSQDVAKSIAVDASGNVYVTGNSMGSGTDYDYATVKYNSIGTEQWVRRYTGSGHEKDLSTSIGVDGSGYVYITGYAMGSGTSVDFVTIKYNSSGVQQWLQTYNGPASSFDGAYSLAIDDMQNVYVAGESIGVGTGSDYCTIKYSQSIGIRKISSEIPNAYYLSQNYPNPFNPSTSIEFSIPKNSFTKITVYDLSGREIETLVDEVLQAGRYKADFIGDRLSSGVYYIKLISGDYVETKKMVVLK